MKNIFHKTLLSLFLIGFASVSLAYVTVGATADCDYNNLLDAYNDADPFVRVTTEQIHDDSFTISKTKWFTGGYSTCAFAEAGIQGGGWTRWVAPANGMTTIDINPPTSSIVVMDRFDISGGVNTATNQTGGIEVRGNVAFTIANSKVHDHESEYGGGLLIHGEDVRVIATNTEIYNNTSIYGGGGVLCSTSATFTLMGNSNIRNNEALGGADLAFQPGHGGGINASFNCQVTINSGDSNDIFAVDYGVYSNVAAGKGGGIYLRTGAEAELIGNLAHPASIIGNVSNIDTTNVILGGGGVYVEGDGNFPSDGTAFTSTNGRIEFNVAKHAAAGFAVTGGGTFTMNRLDGGCWDNNKCSSLSLNNVTDATGNAGAGYIYDLSSAEISGTYIFRNTANQAALFELNVVGSLTLEGNLIRDNGPFSQAFASELIDVTGNNSFASNLDFKYNTVVENNVGRFFYTHGSSQHWLRIYNSIIHDQGDILDIDTGNIDPDLIINCNYVHETASIGAATSSNPNFNQDNFNLNPNFVNSGAGDFHLSPGSFAKDLCTDTQAQSRHNDLNGNPRGINDPGLPDLRGPFDAGAYEDISFDIIFENSFD